MKSWHFPRTHFVNLGFVLLPVKEERGWVGNILSVGGVGWWRRGKRSLSPRSKGCAKCGSNSSKIVSSLSSFQYFEFFFNSFIVSALIAFFCLVFLPPFLLPSVPAHSSFFPFPQPLTSSFLFAQPPLLSLTVSLSYCLSLLMSRSPHLTSCRFCYIIHTVPTVFSELNTRGSSR